MKFKIIKLREIYLHKDNIYNKWKKLISVLRMYNVFMKIYIHYKSDIIV